MKKLLQITGLLIISITLSGCLQISSHHTIKKNGNEDIELRVTLKVPKEFASKQSGEKMKNENILEKIPKNIRTKVSFNEFENGGEIIIKNITPEEKNKLIEILPENNISAYTLKEKNGIYRYEIDPQFIINAMKPLEGNSEETISLEEIIFLNHSVTVYGEIIKTNGLKLSNNVVSFWDMNLDQIYFVEFKDKEDDFLSVSSFYENKLFIIFILLIFSSIFIFHFFVKKKRR